MKRIVNRIISVVMAAAILFSAAPSKVSAEENEGEIYITSENDFLEFAGNCVINSYSKGVKFVLKDDISLSSGIDFNGVPIFCGNFDGNGHTISGLLLRDDGSNTGLFRYVDSGAIVKNLTVKGVAAPGGSQSEVGGICGVNRGSIIGCEFAGSVKGADSIGGIAGENSESGVISGCKTSGIIIGDHYTGGIAGKNLGVIMNSESSASVNTSVTDTSLSFEDIDWESIVSTEDAASQTDTGGIAGFSSGIIQQCKNNGTVGYQHVGYNVGGIVGRQSGFINKCENHGKIYGRKDIGGIVGQMEPYRSIEFSEDAAQKLSNETDKLSERVNKLIEDARGSGSNINAEIQTLTNQMTAAQNSVDNISDRAQNIFNGYSDGINEISARVSEAIDGVAPALENIESAMELFTEFTEKTGEVLDELEESGQYTGAAIDQAREGLKTINDSVSVLEGALRGISGAASNLGSALGDTESVKNSIDEITGYLGSAANSIKNIAGAAEKINKALYEISEWVTDGRDWKRLGDAMGDLADSFGDIFSALSQMSAALSRLQGSIDSGEVDGALDALNKAAQALSNAAEKLAKALGGLSGGSGGITDIISPEVRKNLEDAAKELQNAANEFAEASKHISNAVDTDELKKALQDMQKAAKRLENAMSDASDAVEDVNEALDRIGRSNIPEDTLETINRQITALNNAVTDIADAMEGINGCISDINNQINAGALQDSLDQVSESIDEIADMVSIIESSGDDFDSASSALVKAVVSLSQAAYDASEASDILADISRALSDAMIDLAEVTGNLADKPAVEFPAADEQFTAAVDSLSSNMNSMVRTFSSIGNTLQGQGDLLLDDFQAISDEIGVIIDILEEVKEQNDYSEEYEEGYAADISEEDSESSKQGKAAKCFNYGKVEGDVNVGGISGSMAIEIDFDPEDDIVTSGERSMKFSYNVKDIISGCGNYGDITSKKNYCGGIVGRMDMGAVKNSVHNGTLKSTGGGYIGGIAGASYATIRGCTSKAAMSGGSYIGGIAGEGFVITGSLAIVDITEYTEKTGSIAGYADLTDEGCDISGNYFVDRGTAGIDGISYKGLAEPIGYNEFAEKAGDAAAVELIFLADGEEIDRMEVEFGGSVDKSELPEIPQKEGCFAIWSEDFDYDNITFTHFLEAEYIDYVTTIASARKNESGAPLVLADGIFDDNAIVSVETQSDSIFTPESSDELRIVTVDFKSYDDGSPSALRFLKAEGDGAPELKYFVNGAWKKAEFTENGSYLIVNNPVFENGRAAYCVSVKQTNYMVIIIAAIVGGVAVINIVLIIILISRKRASKNKKPEHAANK